MIDTVSKVKEFHETFDHPVLKLKDAESLKLRQLRIKLLFEELHELAEAGDVMNTFINLCFAVQRDLKGSYSDFDDTGIYDRVEELDALCDLQYVLDGKKLTSGLHEVFDEAFKLVHENNMGKAHRDDAHVQETAKLKGEVLNTVKRNGLVIAIKDGGKIIKPHDHKKVSLSHLI